MIILRKNSAPITKSLFSKFKPKAIINKLGAARKTVEQSSAAVQKESLKERLADRAKELADTAKTAKEIVYSPYPSDQIAFGAKTLFEHPFLVITTPTPLPSVAGEAALQTTRFYPKITKKIGKGIDNLHKRYVKLRGDSRLTWPEMANTVKTAVPWIAI